MESIEKLRTAARNMAKGRNLEEHEECNLLLYIANEIEREIAEKYMELPVDADGVPIHEGDVIQFVNEQGGTGAHVEVDAVSKYYAYYGEGKHFYKASMCRHVKPDPIKELLEKFAYEVCDLNVTVADLERYAAKIREAVSADE